MRILGIDYGDARVGLAITDPLGITAQGLETVAYNGNDKMLLRRLDEIMSEYEIDTIVVGMPYNMDGTKTVRAEATVAAHKTMNFLDVNKHKKRGIVDTISAVYILEMYMNKKKEE